MLIQGITKILMKERKEKKREEKKEKRKKFFGVEKSIQ